MRQLIQVRWLDQSNSKYVFTQVYYTQCSPGTLIESCSNHQTIWLHLIFFAKGFAGWCHLNRPLGSLLHKWVSDQPGLLNKVKTLLDKISMFINLKFAIFEKESICSNHNFNKLPMQHVINRKLLTLRNPRRFLSITWRISNILKLWLVHIKSF